MLQPQVRASNRPCLPRFVAYNPTPQALSLAFFLPQRMAGQCTRGCCVPRRVCRGLWERVWGSEYYKYGREKRSSKQTSECGWSSSQVRSERTALIEECLGIISGAATAWRRGPRAAGGGGYYCPFRSGEAFGPGPVQLAAGGGGVSGATKAVGPPLDAG